MKKFWKQEKIKIIGTEASTDPAINFGKSTFDELEVTKVVKYTCKVFTFPVK